MPRTTERASSIPKLIADRVGRTFNLFYNRVSMYHLDHPSTRDTVSQLVIALKEALGHASPLAVVLDKERLFIEDEPLDPRVNPQRLVGHMKKAGVQSVSFETGVSEKELLAFARIFVDLKAFPTSEEMKAALIQQGVRRVRINHVFFRKVTSDDEVVRVGEGAELYRGPAFTKVLIDTSSGWGEAEPPGRVSPPLPRAMEDELLRELQESLTLSLLVEDPAAVSRKLLETTGERARGEGEVGPTPRGGVILEGIRRLREQIDEAASTPLGAKSAQELVEAVYKLREDLSAGVDRRRQRGDLLVEAGAIRKEMDDLTDQVMVQLVREEYRQGQISVKRLAQIIRRMMPDLRELKRLLPRLKEALLADGMPLSDYLQLIRELERELQTEELALILEEGAEQIGLSVEDLIGEIRRDPKVAAELVAVASEIRALGNQGDQNLLTQILVEYVERVGGGVAIERIREEGPEGVHKLREMVSQVHSELLDKIRKRLGDSSLVGRVQREVVQRQDNGMAGLKAEWVLRSFLADTRVATEPQTILKAIESAYTDTAQQGEVVDLVVQAMEAKGMDPGPLRAALAQKVRLSPGEADPQKAPKGTFNRNMILFFLREEVKRAKRYPYVFSALLMSVRLATALKPVPLGMIRPHEIRNALMLRLTEVLRDVDLVGCLEDNKALALLPFTGGNASQIVRRRLHEALDGKTVVVRNIPMNVKVAVVEDTFEKDRVQNLPSLLARLEAKLSRALGS
jgi:hypothetical protein